MHINSPASTPLRLRGFFLPGSVLLLFILLFMALPDSARAKNGKDPETVIKRNDANGDGKISRNEWRKSSEIFDQIDSDKDGSLTVEELRERFSGGGGKKRTQSMSSPEKKAGNLSAAGGKNRGLWYGDELYWQGPIIDAHSQVDQKTNLSDIVPLLDEAGVSRVILSTRFSQPTADILSLAARYPDRIFPAAKTKTKAFMKGKGGFPNDFYDEIKRSEFIAMAEIIMWHAEKKGVGAGKASMNPDDPRIELMMNMARQKGWPFIAHVEFSAMGFEKARYMKKFEAFLTANQDMAIGMIHMGQLKAKDAARLLQKYSNLFFITSHSNPVTAKSSRLPWTNMFKGEQLAPAWKELLLRFPDRFVMAFDNVFNFHWEGKFLPQVLVWRKALRELPEEVSHALTHGNAERLWKLPPAVLP